MSSHGVLTAKIGDFLETSLDPKIYNVLYDHGKAKANVGKIISWFGEAGRPRARYRVGPTRYRRCGT